MCCTRHNNAHAVAHRRTAVLKFNINAARNGWCINRDSASSRVNMKKTQPQERKGKMRSRKRFHSRNMWNKKADDLRVKTKSSCLIKILSVGYKECQLPAIFSICLWKIHQNSICLIFIKRRAPYRAGMKTSSHRVRVSASRFLLALRGAPHRRTHMNHQLGTTRASP